MNWIIKSILVLLPIALFCGCSAKPAGPEPAMKKVSEQHLATYSPLHRLTYRSACKDTGPLTVCVERISLSETASMVELSIHNRSSAAYQPGAGNTPSMQLSTSSGAFLKGAMKNLAPIPGLSQKYLYCRLDGQLHGGLKTLTLDNIFAQPAARDELHSRLVIDLDS